MKKGDILIAPEGCRGWLTPFKEYEVGYIWDDSDDEYGCGIYIIDDQGDIIGCFEKQCPHLKSQDWIIKSEAEKEWNDLNGLIQLTEEQAKRKEYLTKCLKK